MASVFTRIIQGEIPSHKLLEDERFFAFLDINPINPGHTLVAPKVEIDYLFDHDNDVLAGLLVFAKPLAHAIEQATGCVRVGLLLAGLEVPHAHLHLVPIAGEGELTFARARPGDPEELARLAEKIRSYL